MHPHVVIDLIAWAAAFAAGRYANALRKDAGAPLSAKPYPVAYFAWLACGTLAGAFGLGTLNLLLSDQPNIGRSVIGALAGGIVAVEAYKRLHDVSGSTGGAFVAAFSVGVCIGRIGCFMSGLDDFTHGTPSTLPWAVDLGDGVLRHPVQLYESIAMGVFALSYGIGLRVRARWAVVDGFYWMVLVYAAQRFVWEFFKPYGDVVGPLGLFQLVALALAAYAIAMLNRRVP